MLTATGLTKKYEPRTLFRDVSIQLSSGRRIALVGGNGVGKTTLIEILIGSREPDSGQVHRPKEMTIGYLPQELDDELDGTILAVTLEGAKQINEAASKLSRLELQLGSPDTSDHERILAEYGEVQSRFQQLGGYSIEAEAHRVLAGLGFSGDSTDRQVRELSGGWRMRVSLARLLLSRPDILILDEPTNHLDVDSVAWLEDQLSDWHGSLLFVSHDRDFIDNVANRVIEIDSNGSHEYVGGFAEFVIAREERLAQIEAAAAQQSRRLAHTEKFIERFRYKATKARQVQSRVKALEKIDRIKVPEKKELRARFEFPAPQRSSRIVAEITDASVGYDGKTVLGNLSFVIERGKKIALVGPNGAGKTTLLKLLTGELTASHGKVELGNNVDYATFSQHLTEVMDLDNTVLAEFKSSIGDPGTRNLRTILGGFGFRGEMVDRRIANLSGGERTRLALAEVMANPVNLLILDEPTNHLDLPSCDLLEDALSVYPGTVLLVTHDRHLIRNVADALIVVRDGQAIWHQGVEEDLLRPGNSLNTPSRSNSNHSRKTKSAPVKQERRSAAEHRNERHQATRDLKKQLNRVELNWEKVEKRVTEIQTQLADPKTYEDAEVLRTLTREHEETSKQAAKLMENYEHLTSKIATIEEQ
ncbi:MAG: ATP-binding cassette domain-containing protein [Actinobacteria bacterium]|nr:ATP-binding cassette domain-containing protein [Actinomycetota bacterium]